MSKNFRKDGKWVENPHEPVISTCACGGKYIQTRSEQSACLHCHTGAHGN